MKHSRRDFIQKSSLGLIGFTFLSNSILFGKSSTNILGIEEMLNEASNFKNIKEFQKAENIYLSIIQNFPNDKRAYFALRKTYLIQNKFLENIRLFESAIQAYPKEPIFLNQLAKEYTSIALGNTKTVNQLNYNFSLIEKAKELYKLAKENSYSSTNRLMRSSSTNDTSDSLNNSEVGLKKIDIIIGNSLTVIDSRDNESAKQLLANNRTIYRSYEESLSKEMLINRISELKNKPKNLQRDKYIKRSYRELIYKLFKEKNYSSSYQYAQELYTYDKTDMYSFNLYKKSCSRYKQFDTLENILLENDNVQKTDWSRIGYIKILLFQYEKNNNGNLSTIENLVISFESSYKMTRSNFLEIQFLKTKLYTLKKDYLSLENSLNVLSKNLMGSKSSHGLVRYMNAFSNYYIAKNKKNEAIILVNSFLYKSNNYEITEELSNQVLNVSQLKSYEITDYSHQKEIVNLKKRIQAS